MQSLLEIIEQFWFSLQQGQLPELGHWNYILLSLLIVWQGPVATLLGGAAASAGLLKPGLVFVAGVAGNLTADIVWYTVGRRGNVDRLFERRFLIAHRHRFERLKFGMRQHAPKILLMAKLSAGLAVPALLAAGISRLRWKRWLPVVFIGETIWTGALVLIGFYATELIKQIEHGMQLFLATVSFLMLAALVWFVPRIIRESHQLNVSGTEDNQAS